MHEIIFDANLILAQANIQAHKQSIMQTINQSKMLMVNFNAGFLNGVLF